MLISLISALWITFAACSDTVIIDSVAYPVPEQWCGKMIDTTLIADKTKLVRLPEQYCYKNWGIYLERSTRDALVAMAEAAAKDSIHIVVYSGYRSREYQQHLIKKRLDEGKDIANILLMVAPPGYSEHETGRAVDLVHAGTQFSKSSVYHWLKEHAAQWGFVETYPNDSTNTIYWEPWHWYYRGTANR